MRAVPASGQRSLTYSSRAGFGHRRFRPALVPTLALLLVAPLCVALGLWQLDRADQKRALAAALAEQAAAPPLQLTALPADPERLRGRSVVLTGSFDASGQVYLEHRRQAGRDGFHVITPLRLADSELRVLVNRGWVPLPSDPAALPTAPVPAGPVTVHGTVEIPKRPALVLGSPPAAGTLRWPWITPADYAATVAFPVAPLLVLQASGDEGGFARSWPHEAPDPTMHTGYALQWFTFAAIALLVWLRLSWVRREEEQP